MPCDSITTQTVNLAKALPDVLRRALEAAGWTIREYSAQTIDAYRSITGESMTWTAGQGMTVRGNAKTAGIISQAYSRAAVTWAAQRAGWTVSKTDGNKINMERR